MKTGILFAVLFATASVYAQETATGALEEIVVTAQRRSERLQDVPVVVTAFSAGTLTQMGIATTTDLVAAIPGLDFTRQGNGATVYIRGVGNPNGAIGQESSVALYVDGVYLPSPVGAMFSFNNIEQLEVLKGPQGTLFGRNATGGVIQIATKDPSQTTSADVSVGYGSYQTTQTSFYGTTGVTSTLATDLSFYGLDQEGGWGRDLTVGRAAYREQEWAVRNKWLWTPADGTEVRFAIDAGQVKSNQGVDWHILPGTKGVDGSGYAGFYNTLVGLYSQSLDKYGGVSVNLRQDVGFAKLVGITSYRGISGYYSIDEDATPSVVSDNYVYEKQRTLSQELQLLSNSAGKLQWIVGAFFYHDQSQFNPVRLTGQLGGLPFLDIYADETTKSYAAFAQATAEILPQTDLTTGIRYTKDDRDITGYETFPGVVLNKDAGNASFSKITWRLALDHKFTPDEMAYVSYNRGFKSGLYNLVDYSAPAVRPEILDAYEIGLKSELADRRVRVNVAGFYYDYKDLQVTVVVPGGQTTLNAAAAKLYGADVDVTARATDALTINAGFNYTHARYTSFPAGPIVTAAPSGGAVTSTGNLEGNTPVHTPTFTSTVSPNYHINIPNGALDISATYAHNSGFFWYPDNLSRQPTTNIVNASVKWTSPSGRWSIQGWGKNLTSDEYYSFVSESAFGYAGSPAPPRTYGLTFDLKLGGGT
jgi:iron complex outermembrane receptor protein